MSELSFFFKHNKPVASNEFFPATKSLVDEDGKPLLWEIRRISSREDSAIQGECMYEVPVAGRKGVTRSKLNTNKYVAKLVAASVVVPDLLNAELMQSYGANTPHELVMEMVDSPNEWNALVMFIQEINGFNVSLQEDIDDSKN
jgi:hypothetical protein